MPHDLEVRVPAIGGFKDVGVIDVLVKVGSVVKVDDSLVTLESDKATMDVPSPAAGTVRALLVKLGDRVSEGSAIVSLELADAPTPSPGAATPAVGPAPTARAPAPATAPAASTGAEGPPAPSPEGRTAPAAAPAARTGLAAPPPPGPPEPDPAAGRPMAHASPSVRKLARELGVDLARVTGSGPKGRVLQEDVQRFVKDVMRGEAPGASAANVAGGWALDLLPWPKVDFARFGPVETRALSRIRKISAANLARNWVMIPHVTQHDEADVTELEAFRGRLNEERPADAPRVTLLAFLVKACAAALKRFPEFNASLDGDSLVLKRYYNVGFAADTPNGLVVPVVKEADRKGVLEIAGDLADLAARAREGKLAAADMQGGTFSISSLGGIGGTAFTPIIQAPEVAILGVSRAATRPVWDGRAFAPRLVLPLSLSYDHRVVDGAAAARFTTWLAELLRDLRRAIL
jgi:pyruvate dehydrogenase E2 component (dihydrolipoamide acetyltransferase)